MKHAAENSQDRKLSQSISHQAHPHTQELEEAKPAQPADAGKVAALRLPGILPGVWTGLRAAGSRRAWHGRRAPYHVDIGVGGRHSDPSMTPDELLSRLLFRDGLVLIIDKPAGIPVHAGPGGGDNLEQYFGHLRFGLPQPPSLAHRLRSEEHTSELQSH